MPCLQKLSLAGMGATCTLQYALGGLKSLTELTLCHVACVDTEFMRSSVPLMSMVRVSVGAGVRKVFMRSSHLLLDRVQDVLGIAI